MSDDARMDALENDVATLAEFMAYGAQQHMRVASDNPARDVLLRLRPAVVEAAEAPVDTTLCGWPKKPGDRDSDRCILPANHEDEDNPAPTGHAYGKVPRGATLAHANA